MFVIATGQICHTVQDGCMEMFLPSRKYNNDKVKKKNNEEVWEKDWVSCSVLHHGAAKHLQHPDPADVLLLRITASFQECADVNLGS